MPVGEVVVDDTRSAHGKYDYLLKLVSIFVFIFFQNIFLNALNFLADAINSYYITVVK